MHNICSMQTNVPWCDPELIAYYTTLPDKPEDKQDKAPNGNVIHYMSYICIRYNMSCSVSRSISYIHAPMYMHQPDTLLTNIIGILSVSCYI